MRPIKTRSQPASLLIMACRFPEFLEEFENWSSQWLSRETSIFNGKRWEDKFAEHNHQQNIRLHKAAVLRLLLISATGLHWCQLRVRTPCKISYTFWWGMHPPSHSWIRPWSAQLRFPFSPSVTQFQCCRRASWLLVSAASRNPLVYQALYFH